MRKWTKIYLAGIKIKTSGKALLHRWCLNDHGQDQMLTHYSTLLGSSEPQRAHMPPELSYIWTITCYKLWVTLYCF